MSQTIPKEMLEAFRDDAIETLNRWGAHCVDAMRVPPSETFERILRCAHNLKGNAALIGFSEFAEVMHRIEDRVLKVAGEKLPTFDLEVLSGLMDIERFLREWVEQVSVNPSYVPSDMSVVQSFDDLESTTQRILDPGGSVKKNSQKGETLRSSADANDQVRIPSQKLDTLIQFIGELTLAQAIVSRGKVENRLHSPEVKDAISLCDKLIMALKLSILDIRMLPMFGAYKKLERAALDVSIKLKKPLNFVAEGQEVSVDKAVLARVFDPLMHLVRNAVDHGIESTEVRRRAGKPEQGTISIKASIEPLGLVIQVKDDGGGLDLEKIKARAVAKGLLEANRQVSDQDAIAFIFHPNFSTAEQVTEISGRGVGLDVVQKEINALGGSLNIETKKGEGTTFTLTVPTNLSLIDVMVLTAGDIMYAVPVQDIGEILQVNEVKFESSAMYSRMIRLRDQVIPVEPLSRFMVPPKARGIDLSIRDSMCVLVIYVQGEKYGFLVDEVMGQQQIFVRPARGYLSDLFGVTGTTVLSGGEPAVIVNIKEIAENNFIRIKKGAVLGEHTV